MITIPFKLFYGVVEDVLDPQEADRVRVRCFAFHTDKKSLIPTESLFWANVAKPTTAPSISGKGGNMFLVPGCNVIGYFADGDSCQEPVVMFTVGGVPTEKRSPNVGFSDPSGTYPININESSVNRLVRGAALEETSLAFKDIVAENVTTATGGTWSEPKTKYASQYPKNKVYETEVGHVIELDDTPGAERISINHKSGTFVEIHPDGTVVQKNVNKNFTITSNDDNTLIEGNCNITVNGNSNIYTKGDSVNKIDGNATMDIKGNLDVKTGGTTKFDSKGNFSIKAPRIDMN